MHNHIFEIMKRILYSLVFILTITACQKEKNNLPELMSNYINTSLSLNSLTLTETTKGVIWINNLSESKFEYPAYVSIHLFDTIGKKDYCSNIYLNSNDYSTIENIDLVSNISINGLLSYNKSIEFNKLYWNDGIHYNDLPKTLYRLGLVIQVLEPLNPGNMIQSTYEFIEKKE
ncbi:hypothetical protein ES705_19690 [subsurface metagenome]